MLLFMIFIWCNLFRNTYVQNNRYVNDSLGYMVLDCINTHISSPHLRSEIHKSVSNVLDYILLSGLICYQNVCSPTSIAINAHLLSQTDSNWFWSQVIESQLIANDRAPNPYSMYWSVTISCIFSWLIID